MTKKRSSADSRAKELMVGRQPLNRLADPTTGALNCGTAEVDSVHRGGREVACPIET